MMQEVEEKVLGYRQRPNKKEWITQSTWQKVAKRLLSTKSPRLRKRLKNEY